MKPCRSMVVEGESGEWRKRVEMRDEENKERPFKGCEGEARTRGKKSHVYTIDPLDSISLSFLRPLEGSDGRSAQSCVRFKERRLRGLALCRGLIVMLNANMQAHHAKKRGAKEDRTGQDGLSLATTLSRSPALG